ncbi:MAG: DUF4426 domain-containing protein [Xanthomonadales bacterium]|nr:DUF4426 domain-containing protein [Xanthomonadales bacterium]
MKLTLKLALIFVTALAGTAHAQQSEQFGRFVVHYNAISTNLLTPQVAQQYGIRRSPSRAIVNVTVMDHADGDPGVAVEATVSGTARNLTGQIREIAFRQIREGDDAVYYIGELTVRNMETFDFAVDVLPEQGTAPMTVQFRQQFYTE